MIKLQDFAVQQGVTDRQVQRLLKKYEVELAGLFQRKGPNGTWLSDEACEILRSKMRQHPIVMGDQEMYHRVSELERELYETQKKFTDFVSQSQTLLQQANQQIALAEKSEANQKRAEALEADLSVEKKKVEELALEKEKAFTEAKNALQELEDEKAKGNALEEERNDLKAKIEALENRSFSERFKDLFKKKGK